MKVDRKDKWIQEAPTAVLERITSNPLGAEAETDKTRFPLAGLVHIEGIGQVALAAMREELGKREGSD